MVYAESLSCGILIVGFKAGAPETIVLPDYSEFVEYGDIDALKTVVKEWIHKKSDIKGSIEIQASAMYSKETMTDNYYEMYKVLLRNEAKENSKL